MINLQRLDPDWGLATNHGLASKAGLITQGSTELQHSIDENNQPVNNCLICKCCYEHVHKAEVSIWEHSKQLQFLGNGFPLFYAVLKYAIGMLILSIATYNAVALKRAIQENYTLCSANVHRLLQADLPQTTKICETFMVQIGRIQYQVTSEEQVIRIISFVIQLFCLLYIRNSFLKMEEYYDQRKNSLADYAIFIKGVPKINGIKKAIRQFFNKQFTSQHQIKQITMLPQYNEIQQLKHQRQIIIDTLRVHFDKSQTQTSSQQMATKLQNLKKAQNKIHEAAMHTKQLAQKDQLQCQKIICLFNTQQQKQQVLKQFLQIPKQNKQKYFGDEGSNTIYVSQAPQPRQIIWKNANLTRFKRVTSLLLGWVLSIIVLTIVFIIFFFVLQQKALLLQTAIQEKHSNPQSQQAIQKQRGAIALVFILIFAVILFDKLALASLFYKFTDLQKHSTTAKHQFSFSLKLLLGLFFTTALMTLAVQAIRFHNFYSHPYGVIDQQAIMFFVNALFVPILWLVNQTRIFKLIKRKIYFGKRSMTQRQANQLMQQQRYDVGKRIAQIMQIIWFTYLYATLIPVGAILTCFGLIIYYWVDKYNLLKRSAVIGQVSADLIHKSLTILDFSLLMFPIGSIIFDTQIRNSYVNSSIAMIVIAFVYIILPKDKILQVFNHQKFNMEVKTYTDVKQNFSRTYHTEHPVYRIIQHQKLKNKMLSRGMVFEEITGQNHQINVSINFMLKKSNSKSKVMPQNSQSIIIQKQKSKPVKK